MKYISAFSLIMLLHNFSIQAQPRRIDNFDSKHINWYNQNPSTDGILGAAVDRTYDELIKDKKAKKTIIVAVIDSGVDIDHKDLEGHVWINEDEIPGNQIDDDNNGYVDDIHGWNFIGNTDGRNIKYETFEYTRVVRLCKENNNYSSERYKKAKSLYDAELSKRLEEKKNIQKFEEAMFTAKMIILQKTDVDVKSMEDVSSLRSADPQVQAAKRFLMSRYLAGFSEESLENLKNSNSEFLDKYLNMDFDPRDIVGDDPYNIEDISYGNSDVTGPRASHGSSVAGVIGAIRNNQEGIDGIASSVKIMAIRSTPRGDERDKDVALAIRYAVDNGADVVNMSFGKAISPQKEFVDDAVRYANEHGVLLIHAAGNSGQNIDVTESFPSDRYLDGSEPDNWLNVGASGMIEGKEVAAVFSNYGKGHVDIFAPGEDIVSLDSINLYDKHDGTSLAAPVVSGVAALILSYYPDLKPKELIDILLKSSYKIKKPKVLIPNVKTPKRNKTKFKNLSRCGGIVNAYEAFKLAESRN